MQITGNTKAEFIDKSECNEKRKLWQLEAQCNGMLEIEKKS